MVGALVGVSAAETGARSLPARGVDEEHFVEPACPTLQGHHLLHFRLNLGVGQAIAWRFPTAAPRRRIGRGIDIGTAETPRVLNVAGVIKKSHVLGHIVLGVVVGESMAGIQTQESGLYAFLGI